MPDEVRQEDEDPTLSTLDEAPQDPVDFWSRKQRELVTSVVDYNLGTLSDLINDKSIDLSPKYQRRFRWDSVRQSTLIESILMNVPVPPIFLNEDDYGAYSVIDGKQRLTAINEFLRGRLRLTSLAIFADINNLTFDELPPTLQNVLRTRATLRAVIILRQSDKDIKFDVFQRLNTGGVSLNPQEIRNSTWPGPFNDLILELSDSKPFHDLLGIKTKSKSYIYQEMRDAELILRFFTFRLNWQTFDGGMRRNMDNFLARHQKMPAAELGQLRLEFDRTVRTVREAFGAHAFQRWLPQKQRWKHQVLAALFDAEMFAARDLDLADVTGRHHEILEALKARFSDDTFLKAIGAATNTPSAFKARIAIMRDLLRSVRT